MKPLRQASLLIRLLLLTGCWILIQVLLLPLTLHQNDLVMLYSSIGLLSLIIGVTGYDSYCAIRHTKAACFILIDLLTLALAGWLLFLI
ncbi:hypothetical protein [Lactiplantibacillus songbeiensis]|uniref:Integral membrane protein n=1 Tax=Lactiplantibacillus songbeiensis TaxID=2559920 RepID=A0ABW4BX36_9LACO|nr:hypothetical protein [Lactiplantibacillus songbeiensis]